MEKFIEQYFIITPRVIHHDILKQRYLSARKVMASKLKLVEFTQPGTKSICYFFHCA